MDYQKVAKAKDRLIREMAAVTEQERSGQLPAGANGSEYYGKLAAAIDSPAPAGKRDAAFTEASRLFSQDETTGGPPALTMPDVEDPWQPHTEQIDTSEMKKMIREANENE